VPLRGVPYRVVCLVGLDEGALVQGGGDGDDLLQEQPLLGDPDPSGEQRQALLETVLAARERLIVTYSAHDVRSGKEVPAIAPLAELRELLALAGVPVRLEDEVTVPDVQVRHPRHGIDARTFTQGALGCAGAFGHLEAQRDAVGLLRIRAAVSEPVRMADAMARPAESGAPVVTLDDLAAFLDDPLRLYVRRTAGIDVFEGVDEEAAVIPLALGKRERVAAATALLERIAVVPDEADAVAREAAAWRAILLREGGLPPGHLGEAAAAEVEALVQALCFQCRGKGKPMAGGTPVVIDLPREGGLQLRGTVRGVFEGPDGALDLVRVGAERHDARRELVQRLELLAVAAVTDGHPVRSWWIGEHATNDGKTFATKGTAEGGRPGPHVALLARLVALYQESLRSPRSLLGRTGEALVTEGRDKAAAALAGWKRMAKPFDPAVRLYGTTPRLGDLFPAHGAEEDFLRAFVDVRQRMPAVENCRAIAVRARKGGE